MIICSYDADCNVCLENIYRPEVQHSPYQNDGWKTTTFLLGWYNFRGYVKISWVYPTGLMLHNKNLGVWTS